MHGLPSKEQIDAEIAAWLADAADEPVTPEPHAMNEHRTQHDLEHDIALVDPRPRTPGAPLAVVTVARVRCPHCRSIRHATRSSREVVDELHKTATCKDCGERFRIKLVPPWE